MNFLNKKRKKSTEPIIKANGKIVVVDFKKLNPDDFPYNDLTDGIEGQLAVLANDGKIFLNQSNEGYEYISDIFAILMNESRYNLDQYAKIYRKQYPNVTLSNWKNMQGSDKERTLVLAALLCLTEIMRRQVEKAYYSKK